MLQQVGESIKNLDYCNQALEFEKTLSTQFIVLAEYLFNIKEMNLFTPQWESFNEYCMEFKSLSQGSISKLTSIYGKLIVEYDIPKEKIAALGGWSNIAEALPVIKSKADALEWIEKAAVLSRVDLRNEITEKKTGKDMRDCKHLDYYDLRICRVCHSKERIGDSQHE